MRLFLCAYNLGGYFDHPDHEVFENSFVVPFAATVSKASPDVVAIHFQVCDVMFVLCVVDEILFLIFIVMLWFVCLADVVM